MIVLLAKHLWVYLQRETGVIVVLQQPSFVVLFSYRSSITCWHLKHRVVFLLLQVLLIQCLSVHHLLVGCSLRFTASKRTCACFNTFTKLPIIFKANWHSLTQTRTITIDRLLSSHLKNTLLMGEWGTWNHFQWDIKAALWGGLVVITPHRPGLKEAI